MAKAERAEWEVQQDRGEGLQGTWEVCEGRVWQSPVLLRTEGSLGALGGGYLMLLSRFIVWMDTLDASHLCLAPCHPGNCLLR